MMGETPITSRIHRPVRNVRNREHDDCHTPVAPEIMDERIRFHQERIAREMPKNQVPKRPPITGAHERIAIRIRSLLRECSMTSTELMSLLHCSRYQFYRSIRLRRSWFVSPPRRGRHDNGLFSLTEEGKRA